MSRPWRVVELDEVELAVRMLETRMGCKRPTGNSAAEALAALQPDQQAEWLALARTAGVYFAECITSAGAGVAEFSGERGRPN